MKKILLILFFILSIFSLFSCDDIFENEVDRIRSYEITINQKDDGTLDMVYDIDWEVMSNSEGPLSWVIIGIPNKYIDSLKNLSDDCSSVYYDNTDGDYIRCELKNSISKGEKANFKFSFHANALYTFDDNKIYYEFIPGWFDEIKVDELKVYWNTNNVIINNSNKTETNGFYFWNYSLDEGESIEVIVEYNRADYPNLITEGDYKNYQNDQKVDRIIGYVFLTIFIVVFIFIIISIFVYRKSSDEYFHYRGFYSGYRYNWFYIHLFYHQGYDSKGKPLRDPRIVNSSGGSSSGGGRSCACACACACAGGGRAGCSRKEFYKPKLKITDLERVLKDEKDQQ